MIISRSIHVVANSIISFFFKVVYRESLGVGSLSLPRVFFLIIKKMYLFLAVLGLCCSVGSSPCGEGGYSSLRCVGCLLRWLLLLQSTGLWGVQASVVAQAPEHRLRSWAHGLCCSAGFGFFLDQGLNPYLLHW